MKVLQVFLDHTSQLKTKICWIVWTFSGLGFQFSSSPVLEERGLEQQLFLLRTLSPLVPFACCVLLFFHQAAGNRRRSLGPMLTWYKSPSQLWGVLIQHYYYSEF